MLRLFVLLLVLANAGYYAYHEGLLAGAGFAPAQQSEPQRMAGQIQPEAMQLLTPTEARQLETGASSRPAGSASASAASSPASSGECLQAGTFTDEQAETLRGRLSSLPASSWLLEASTDPGRWIIYMGRFANVDALAKKRTELRERNVPFERLRNPTLEPGLGLGGFATEAEADAALTRMAAQGVRTARVLQEKAEVSGQRLRFPAADTALLAQLDALKLPLAGKTLQSCR
ncbi:MAG: SPOR domain-containing protein [Polaromonas sp.]|nr:SPOR domain-containing protein [Polaromonas sp.]